MRFHRFRISKRQQSELQRTARARRSELCGARELLLQAAWELRALLEVQHQFLEALQLTQLRERRHVHEAPAGVTFCPTC